MTCLYQKIHYSVSNQRDYQQQLKRITSEKDTSKYRGSMHNLSMLMHYPNYTNRIRNASPGYIFGGIYI